MQQKYFLRTGLLVLSLVSCFIGGWEWYWRAKGFKPTFNDDKALWAAKRSEAYQPIDKATVFIGSSRIKFDLDLATWKEQTGENAVQLALVGTSPLLLLKDFADDENFHGKLVVDITEVLFFSKNPAFQKSATEAISFYRNGTISEKWSSAINTKLESSLVFLEEERFALNTLLNDLQLPNRPGVFSFPSFPKGFQLTTRDRQTYMSAMFLSNPADIKRQTDIWSMLIMGDPTPPVSGTALTGILSEIKVAVDKIRSRGGRVIFVRTPSSGPMAEGERKAYPRNAYWDQILSVTGAEGIHYADYPETKNMICPEWSHLSPKDAIEYTRYLAKQLFDKGWFNGYSMKSI